jgi:sulfite exporter TauE/SafE
MAEDIRFPIGGLFTILGAILAIYGLVTDGSEIYARVPASANIITGLAMLVFGLLFLVMAYKKNKKGKLQ